jgi:hypothetical protein
VVLTVALVLAPRTVQAGATPAPVVPPKAITNLTAWYDANTGITSSGGLVSQWGDQSGNNNTLTQSTSGVKPTYTTVSSNKAVVFNGAQYLQSSTTNTFVTGGGNSSMFVVAAYTGSNAEGNTAALSYGTSTTEEARALLVSTSRYKAYASSATDNVFSSTVWASTGAIVYGAFGSGLLMAIGVNGATPTNTATSYTLNTTASTPFIVGKWVDMDFYWIGPIYEILVYNGIPTTAERQFIEGYLACKWGFQSILVASHPYASSCPTLTATSGVLALTLSETGSLKPATDVVYTETFANSSGTLVYNPSITASIPSHTYYKVGADVVSLGSTGLGASSTAYYSNAGCTTSYTPVSGGGGAPSGYDANVQCIKWTLTGALGTAPSVNSGTLSYSVEIQ